MIIGDEYVAIAVHRNSAWAPQTRARGRSPVAAEARHTGPCHRCDDSRSRSQPPNAVIVRIGDKHAAVTIDRDPS